MNTEVQVVKFEHPPHITKNALYGLLTKTERVNALLKEGRFLVELVSRPMRESAIERTYNDIAVIDLRNAAFRITAIENRDDGIYCTIERMPYHSIPIDIKDLNFFFRGLWKEDEKIFILTKPVCYLK